MYCPPGASATHRGFRHGVRDCRIASLLATTLGMTWIPIFIGMVQEKAREYKRDVCSSLSKRGAGVSSSPIHSVREERTKDLEGGRSSPRRMLQP